VVRLSGSGGMLLATAADDQGNLGTC
jgi:hypothetical protein